MKKVRVIFSPGQQKNFDKTFCKHCNINYELKPDRYSAISGRCPVCEKWLITKQKSR